MRSLLGAGRYVWLYVALVPFYFNEAAFRIILPPYLQEIGFGLGLIGVLIALYGVAALASRLPVGLLYRRDQARWIAAGALAGTAVISFSYTVAHDPLAIGLLRLGHGLLMGTAGTLHLALFLEARPPGIDRGRATALHASVTTTAFLIGNFAAGAIADLFGYPVAFAVAGSSALLAGFLTLLIAVPEAATPPLPNPGGKEPAPSPLPGREGSSTRTSLPALSRSSGSAEESPSRRGSRGPSPQVGEGGGSAGRSRGIIPLLRNRGVRQTCIASLAVNLIVEMTWNFVPLWGVAAGYSLATVGAVRSAGNVGGLFSRALAGEVGRYTGWGVLSAGSLVLIGFVIIVLPSSTSLAFLAFAVTALATVRGLMTVANNVILMEETDSTPSLRGMGSAVISMSRDIGSILGPIIGGFVAAAYGLDNMFRLVPIPLVALYIPLLASELALRRRQLAQASVGRESS